MTPRILRWALPLAACTCANAWAGVELESFVISPGLPSPNIFGSVGPQGAPGPEAGPGATVAWPVTINTALLETLPATVQVNFPDRPSVGLVRLRHERRGAALLWTGQGGDCSAMFRIAYDGGFKGTVSCLSAPYGIEHATGSADVRLTRYDDAGQHSWDESLSNLPPEALVGDEPLAPALPQGVTDTTVDILVLYNSSLAGVNIWQDAIDQVQTIQHAMDISTIAGQTVIAQVRLAGAARIVRSVPGVSDADLDFLREDTQVGALRDYYAADIVLYLNSGVCEIPGQSVTQGIAYLPGANGVPPPPAPAWAFAASLYPCSDNPGDWVAAHEVGHVFGANHNYDHLPRNPTPLQPSAWGHWARHLGSEPTEGARTIMVYEDECLAVVENCPRIQHYSSPGISVLDWFETGSAEHDNAQVIRLYAPVLARYRDSQGRIFKYGFE